MIIILDHVRRCTSKASALQIGKLSDAHTAKLHNWSQTIWQAELDTTLPSRPTAVASGPKPTKRTKSCSPLAVKPTPSKLPKPTRQLKKTESELLEDAVMSGSFYMAERSTSSLAAPAVPIADQSVV